MEEVSLYISFSGSRKGEKASKSTIAVWIRSKIYEVYNLQGLHPPVQVKAYCTRALASSWAERADAFLEQRPGCNATEKVWKFRVDCLASEQCGIWERFSRLRSFPNKFF